MMRGMTPQELENVRAFVMKHHRFPYTPKENRLPGMEYGFGIKYIDVCFDSRDQTYWAITFRPDGICFRANHFTALNPPPKGWKYSSVYDLTMAFLNGEFKPKDEFFRDPREEKAPEVKVEPILLLDCHDTGVWFVKDRLTGEKKNFDSGDAGKLAAYEHIYRNQRFDI